MTDSINIKAIVHRWIVELLTESANFRMTSAPMSEAAQQDMLKNLDTCETQFRSGLGRNDFSQVNGVTQVMLEDAGIKLAPNSIEFREAAREVMQASIRSIQIDRQRIQGKFDEEIPLLRDMLRAPGAPSTGPSLGHVGSIPISKAYGLYEQEMLAGNRWTEKTVHTNRAMFETMVEIIGDPPIAVFDKAMGREYKAGLQRYPVNRRNDPRYRDLPLKGIWAKGGFSPLSVTSVNNHLSTMVSFGGWAVNQGYLVSNPLAGLGIRTKEQVKDKVQAFSQEQLKAIFNSPLYRDKPDLLPYQFWLPLLGLHTGARIEELCALHADDIAEINGVWCIVIRDTDQRLLKTAASKRLVPVHPELERIGFLDFAQARRTDQFKRLFPELTKYQGKVSHMAVKWFSKLKRSLGFKHREHVFHSFRHTFISKLRDSLAPDYSIKLLVGHATGSVTHDVYGTPPEEVRGLAQVVNALDFGVELAGLKFKRGDQPKPTA